jgi:serine/threonine-protein kinase
VRQQSGTIVEGRYRLEKVLGEGGHAVVWGAIQILTQRRVALKFFKERGPRNLIEARAATHLEHPHVIRVHDVFASEDGSWIMVMDWLEGESLATMLEREEKLSLSLVIELFLPIVEALALAHRAGIVHRDLKPSNIFVVHGENGIERLVLLDFGVAKFLGDALVDTAHTASGTLIGTPHYMAPEQVFGESSADARVDLWSLGIVLTECITGKRPTDAPNVGGVLKRITMRNITKLRTLAPDLPSALLEHVDRLLSFEPSERPAHASETIRVLTELRDGKAPSSSTAKTRRRPLATIVLTTSTILAVIIGFGARTLASRRPEEPRPQPSSAPAAAVDAEAPTTNGISPPADERSSVTDTATSAPVSPGRLLRPVPPPEAKRPATSSGTDASPTPPPAVTFRSGGMKDDEL